MSCHNIPFIFYTPILVTGAFTGISSTVIADVLF